MTTIKTTDVSATLAKALCKATAARLRGIAETGTTPLTLELASAIRGHARAERDIEIGRLPSTADWLTMQHVVEGGVGVQSDVPTGGEGVQSKPATPWQEGASDVAKEFPDYGEALPAIPCMRDESWKNDVCPVMRDITGMIELWCDYADVSKREFAETPRYSLHVGGAVVASGETLDPVILGWLRKALIQRMVATWNYDPQAASYSLDSKGFTTEFRA